MPTKRLAEVIREECLRDGPGAYVAFKSMAALETDYPVVAAAVRAEAELRPTMGGPAGALEKLARPIADQILSAEQDDGQVDDEADEENRRANG